MNALVYVKRNLTFSWALFELEGKAGGMGFGGGRRDENGVKPS